MDGPLSRTTLLISHPVTLYILQTNMIAIVLGFTAPNSTIRPLAFPIMLVLLWLLVSNCFARTQNVFWATVLGGGGAAYAFQYIETALLTRWNFESQGPQRLITTFGQTKGQRRLVSTPWQRLRFGYYATFSYRCCGTPFEVKNVPPFSSTDRSYVPTRRKFILQCLRNYLLSYLIIDAITVLGNAEANSRLYAAEKIPFFFRIKSVSFEEIAVRIASTVFFWGASYLIIWACFAAPAISGVALRLTEVSWWHPLMGPMANSYSIRQFWA